MQVHEHLPVWRSTETVSAVATAAAVGVSTIIIMAALGYYTLRTAKRLLMMRQRPTWYNDKKHE